MRARKRYAWNEKVPFHSLALREELARGKDDAQMREGQEQDIRFTKSSRRITTFSFSQRTLLVQSVDEEPLSGNQGPGEEIDKRCTAHRETNRLDIR